MGTLHTELLAFADYALIDQTNKLSVIGIFNELNVAQFPGGLARVFLVATFVGSVNETYKLTLQVKDEEKKDIFPELTMETKTSFTGKNNLLVTINNFVFPHAGEYTATILHEGKKVGATSINVVHAKQNTTGQGIN